MNQGDLHLNIDQVEHLIDIEPTEPGGDTKSVLLDEARQHLAICRECQILVATHRDGDRLLRRLRSEFSETTTVDCPSELVLYQLAGGTIGSEEAETLLEHTAHCDHCGPLLRIAAEDLSMQETTEETAFRSSLQTAQGGWQQDFAKKLATQPAPASAHSVTNKFRDLIDLRWLTPKIQWATVVVALLLLAAAATRYFQQKSSTAYADRLLAQAYTEQRTLELRIPGADYAPIRETRGSGGSNVEKPPVLNEVEAVIGKNLARNPNEPSWLQAKGRADLLDGRYDSSIASLKRALDAKPDSPSLFTDLGAAYFQRARPGDDGTAFEYLSKALAITPDDQIVLFNRAIVAAHLHLYAQAIDDWQHYLRLDPVGPWAEDARRHLRALESGPQSREKGLGEPLLSPSEFVSGIETQSGALEDEVDPRIEDYLSVAVRDWLPQAFDRSTHKPEYNGSLQKALRVLSRLSSTKHGDTWLADLLAYSSGDSFPSAVSALARSVKASDSGDYSTALQRARQSAILFEASGNTAGAMRASVEVIYALHLLRRGDQCLQAVAATGGSVKKSTYRWLQIQFLIEHATCLSIMGNLGKSEQIIVQGLRLAQASGYKTIYLRAIGLASDTNAATGNMSIAWMQASEGLNRFWSGNYPPIAGYNLYTNLDVLADATQQPRLQVAVWRQALALIDSDQDLLQRAMAHNSMADAAFMADMPQIAEREFESARDLLNSLPQGDAARSARVESEISLARLEGRRGLVDHALVRLGRIAPLVSDLSNNYQLINFYTTEGELLLRRSRNAEAEKALTSAVALAEWSLHSLNSDQERVTWNREASGAYRALTQLKLQQGDVRGSVEVWEWYRGASMRRSVMRTPTARDLVNGFALPNLQVVAQRSSTLTHQTVISFCFLPDGLAEWIVDDRGTIGRMLPSSAAEVSEIAERFTELSSSPNSNIQLLNRDSRKLYDLLIAPISEYLGPRRDLLIETDGPLSGIPMEALLDPNSRYLGETRSISISPGFYYSRKSRLDQPISRDSAGLFVAGSSTSIGSDENLAPLPDAIDEIETISRAFRDAKLLVGNQATLEAVNRALGGVSVFHFAGHSVSSGAAKGLILATSLSASEGMDIFKVNELDPRRLLHLQLAVLSVCTTESVNENISGNPDSFVRVLLQAGVPQIVASRWDVDSAATSLFMKSFYRSLLSGKNAPQSLHDAEFELRLHPGTSHPYYWAGFATFSLI